MGRVTDPSILAALEGGSSGRVEDPAILAALEGNAPPKKSFVQKAKDIINAGVKASGAESDTYNQPLDVNAVIDNTAPVKGYPMGFFERHIIPESTGPRESYISMPPKDEPGDTRPEVIRAPDSTGKNIVNEFRRTADQYRKNGNLILADQHEAMAGIGKLVEESGGGNAGTWLKQAYGKLAENDRKIAEEMKHNPRSAFELANQKITDTALGLLNPKYPLMASPAAFGAFEALAAYGRGEALPESVVTGLKSTITAKAFGLAHGLPQGEAAARLGGLGAFEAAVSGGSPSDILESGATQAAFGSLASISPSGRKAYESAAPILGHAKALDIARRVDGLKGRTPDTSTVDQGPFPPMAPATSREKTKEVVRELLGNIVKRKQEEAPKPEPTVEDNPYLKEEPSATVEPIQEVPPTVEPSPTVEMQPRVSEEQIAPEIPLREPPVEPVVAETLPETPATESPLTDPLEAKEASGEGEINFGSVRIKKSAIPKYQKQLRDSIQSSHNSLYDTDALLRSGHYDGSFPIPKMGGLVAAKKTEMYRTNEEYQGKIDDAIQSAVESIRRANEQLNHLSGNHQSGNFDVSYDIQPEKVKAGYTVNVARAWNMEARSKYPSTRNLGDVAVREGLQNSLDATLESLEKKEIKHGEINITVNEDGQSFVLEDNGVGMSDTDIRDKFLALHSTGKDAEGRFGGFGIAKAVILGPDETASWELHTRDNYFTSKMAQDTENVVAVDPRKGTKIVVSTDREILSEEAKMYTETTETPKNISVLYNGEPVVSPFRGLRGKKETVELGEGTTMEITYYPKPPEGYNKKEIIRLVDAKTKSKLTQGISSLWSDGFNGTMVVDITTNKTPGSWDYPLTDSRMELKYEGGRRIRELEEKYSVDKKTAQRSNVEAKWVNATEHPPWNKKISTIEASGGYKRTLETINNVFNETDGYGYPIEGKPYTPLDRLSIKIDSGYKGPRGITEGQAKHLAAYESTARLYANHVPGARVDEFYAILSQSVDGGIVASEYNGNSLGLNYLAIDKNALASPLEYALYLRDLVAHELTHAEHRRHNEDFTSAMGQTLNSVAPLFKHTLRIAEAVAGKKSDIIINKERVVEKLIPYETVVEKEILKYFTPEQQKFVYEQIEKGGFSGQQDLYYPTDARQQKLFGPGSDSGYYSFGGEKGGVEYRSGAELANPQGDGETSGNSLGVGKAARPEPVTPRPPTSEPPVSESPKSEPQADLQSRGETQKAKAGYVFLKRAGREAQYPFTEWREITKGKHKGKIGVTVRGREFPVERKAVKMWPEGQSGLDKLAQEQKRTAQIGAIGRDVVSDQPIAPHTFADPQTERLFQTARGLKKPSVIEHIRTIATEVSHKFTRDFEHLASKGENAQIVFDLKRLEKQKDVVADRTVRSIGETLSGMNKQEYDVFNRKVVLDDLLADYNRGLYEGKDLPFGFTPESLTSEVGRLDAAVGASPNIQEALGKRQAMWDQVKGEYTEALSPFKSNVEDMFRENYYRHQVLDYIDANGLFGTGKRLRSPTNKGYTKERQGYSGLYNTDYLEAEHQIMAQMLHDIETAKTLTKIKDGEDISQIVRTQAKERGLENWHDAIPEGYTTWQPKEGSVFHPVLTIDEKIAAKLLTGEIAKFADVVGDLKQVLAVGGKRKEWVVRQEVADTLDNLVRERGKGIISSVDLGVMTAWKKWQLISPRRVIKYNIRNLMGDAEGVFLGNPAGFREVPRAISELYDTFYQKKAMPPDMKEWFDRGGMSSTLQAQEMDSLKQMWMFSRLHDGKGGLNVWKKYWETSRHATDFRESVLRYANFLDYKKQLIEGSGKPKNYGASKPEMIDALEDISDKAFWLSNDLLGAYDRISVAGQVVRERAIPFWSWQEVNFKRYTQLYKNAAGDAKLTATIGKQLGARSAIVAMKVGRLALKTAAFATAVQVYNYTLFPEEEKQLPNDVRSNMHIILGKDEKGNIQYFNRMGTLDDFLSWFGLDYAPQFVGEYLDGKRTLKELLQDQATKTYQAPVNKVIQGAAPFSKLTGELITRKTTFPDVFKTGTIRDRYLHIARSFGLENEYIAMAGLPSKGYGESLGNLVVYRVDPGEAAYRNVYDMKNNFMKKQGKTSEGFWLTPMGDALYNMKLAVKYKDKQAYSKYLSEYTELATQQGRSNHQIRVGIDRSIQTMNPLYGMSRQVKRDFLKSLNAEDKETLKQAMRFYTDTIRGQPKP